MPNPIDVPAEARACPRCGKERTCIGHDTTEVIDLIPAQVIVRLDRREKLACMDCEAALVRAPGSTLDLSGVDPETIARLAALTQRYDVKELQRFAPAKRYAPVVCFLVEAHKTILDHVVEMHRVYMIS